jgi:hypothetical protein
MPTRNNKGIIAIRDVTRTAIAVEQLSKHVSAETNTRNNRGAFFSVLWYLPRGYKKDKEDCGSQLSSGVPRERLFDSRALRRQVRRDGSCIRELDREFQSWQSKMQKRRRSVSYSGMQ